MGRIFKSSPTGSPKVDRNVSGIEQALRSLHAATQSMAKSLGFFNLPSNRLLQSFGPDKIKASQITVDGTEVYSSKGEFTATLTGVTATVTATIAWTILNNEVTLKIPSGFNGTSNTTAMTFTGLPTTLQPNTGRYAFCTVLDSGVLKHGMAHFAPSSGTVILFLNTGTAITSSSFANISAKGLTSGAGQDIRYSLS